MFTINRSPKIRDEIDQAVYERTVAGHKYSHSHVFGAGARPLLDDAPPERKPLVYCIQVISDPKSLDDLVCLALLKVFEILLM